MYPSLPPAQKERKMNNFCFIVLSKEYFFAQNSGGYTHTPNP